MIDTLIAGGLALAAIGVALGLSWLISVLAGIDFISGIVVYCALTIVGGPLVFKAIERR